jgi:hypothetical protein
VHPYRLAYAQGRCTARLRARICRVRTFAVDRISELSLREDSFTPIEELPDQAFPHSLGVHSARRSASRSNFSRGGECVRTRTWHASAAARDRQRRRGHDAGRLPRPRARKLSPELQPPARVISPDRLMRTIARPVQEARAQCDEVTADC